MTYYTAHPDLDAARWEDEQEARQAAAEFAETRAFERIKAALVFGLLQGPGAKLDLPDKLPGRSTSEALYELQNSGPPDLIDRALCLLATLVEPAARDMVQELANTYAHITIEEWKKC